MPDESNDPASRRGPAIALLLIVALLVGGILLQRHLRATGQMEDCLMSGRTNCAPISAPPISATGK
ncbi:MAG: hypothetical protein P4L66_05925 [Acetobacteraceae bacterium]|nr:hypothetical protein [Acetobacteraceae bacterium]